MNKNSRNILIGVVGVAIMVGTFVFLQLSQPSRDESAVRATVTAFGDELQKVSLLAPDASSTIAELYGPYATPALVASWQKDIQHAPGRLTSSPWPDHIQITTAAPQGGGYVVSGAIVLMTSTGLAGVIPVVIQVVPEGSKWVIAAYQEQTVPTTIKQ